MNTTSFRTSSVFAIAPHLAPKGKSRYRQKQPSTSQIFMESAGYESDPPLSDDSRVERYNLEDQRNERYQSIEQRVALDAQGNHVLRRVSATTDRSDTSSSFCEFLNFTPSSS